MAPRILLVDDHALLRGGLGRVLADAIAGVTIGEAKNAEEALAATLAASWDVVILDISLPGRSGLDVLKDLRALPTPPAVLILSMHSEDEYAIRAFRDGASGYLNKDGAPEEIVEAVRRVAAGGKYVSVTLAEKLASRLQAPDARSRHELLSSREYQVLRYLGAGKTVKEIGALLDVSEKTVSTYRTRLLEKMDFKNNADIVRYAVRMGLVE
jgi:DNA-binding NarL/FixJ family response regulator